MLALPVELNELILQFCTTLGLVSLAQTSLSFQILVYTHWKLRNDSVISKYVPFGEEPFFPLLQSTNSAIIGSVAVHLTDNLACCDTNDLELVVPPGTFSTWFSMLLKAQYKCRPGPHVSDNALTFHIFTNGTRTITVTEMKRPFLFPALQSRRCSCDMVMVTSSSFISVYPDTSLYSICVSRNSSPSEPEKENHRKRNIEFHHDTVNWTTACGRYCPDHVENLRDNRAFAALRWNAAWREDKLLHTVRCGFVGESCDSEWAFTPGFPACDNIVCPYYGYEPTDDDSDSDEF